MLIARRQMKKTTPQIITGATHHEWRTFPLVTLELISSNRPPTANVNPSITDSKIPKLYQYVI